MGAKQRAMVLGFAAVIVGVAVWGLTACNRDGDPSSASTEVSMVSGDARIVSEDDLSGLTSDVGHQVFWAGPQADTQLEFSSDDTGNVHLRYLTGGADEEVEPDRNRGVQDRKDRHTEDEAIRNEEGRHQEYEREAGKRQK